MAIVHQHDGQNHWLGNEGGIVNVNLEKGAATRRQTIFLSVNALSSSPSKEWFSITVILSTDGCKGFGLIQSQILTTGQKELGVLNFLQQDHGRQDLESFWFWKAFLFLTPRSLQKTKISPWRPVCPFSPFAPFWPSWPSMPGRPGWPLTPFTPFNPGFPWSPVSPFRPESPCRPVSPRSPFWPLIPLAPASPWMPICPSSPFCPFKPWKPWAPFRPCSPLAPGSPFAPGGPKLPMPPTQHTSENLSCKNIIVWSQVEMKFN